VKPFILQLIDRAARRGATLLAGGLIVSGDDASTTAGVVIALAEYVFESWRARRAARKAAKP